MHLVSALMFLLKMVKTIICRKLRIETNQYFLKNKISQLTVVSVFVSIKKTKLGYWTIQVF